MLYESVRDLEGLEGKKEFLETVEKLMSRVIEKKGAGTAWKTTLKKISEFNKVKNDPVSRDVFDASMRTGVDFHDLHKEVSWADDDETVRRSLVKNFEKSNNKVSYVFGRDFAEGLNAKSTFEIGDALMKKGLSLDRMLRKEDVKKLFLATRFNKPLSEEFKVKPLGFIPDKTFADSYNLSKRYGVDFKKLVESYGKGRIKRNLSIVFNEARGAKLGFDLQQSDGQA